jgi:hypothetical protein
MLVATTPIIVWQCYHEIYECTDKFDVKVYYGDDGDKTLQGSVIWNLMRTSLVFHRKPEHTYSVIVTSYRTLNARHGRNAQKRWQIKNGSPLTGRCLDQDWPGILQNVFDCWC